MKTVIRNLSCLWIALSFASCGNSQVAQTCVPGRVDSCPCLGGVMGVQQCLASGTYDVCMCSAADAGLPDVGQPANDAAMPVDAAGSIDANGLDAFAADAGPLPDAGPVHGHAVVIGNQAYVDDDAVDREIVNAVFLTERPGPIEVVEYTERSEFAGWDTRTRVRGVISAEATARGRTVTYRDLGDAFGIAAHLGTSNVLLIYGQEHASGATLMTIGAGWHDTISSYLSAGGVVVILTSRDVHEEWQLASGTGLFNMSGTALGGRADVDIVMPSDPVAQGVLSPYPPPSVDALSCFPGMTGGVLVARTNSDPVSGGAVLPSLCPVVRHITR